jgi:chitodextrinase
VGSSVSNIITVTTPPLGVSPAPATGLVISNLSTTALTLSWVAPATGTAPFSYQPQRAPVGTTTWTNIGSATSQVSVSVTGLTPNVTYQFQVITSNGSGNSTSAAVQATTLSVAPGAPSGLAVTSTSASSVGLHWSPPAVGTTPFTYQVSLASPTGSGAFGPFSSTTLGLTQTITGLASGTGYDFEVAASNAAGSGPQSVILVNAQTTGGTGTTGPGPATGLAVSNLATTSLTLSWVAPSTGTTPFSFQPQQMAAGATVWTNIGIGIAGTTVAVTGLSPNVAYQFQIVTSNTSTATSISAAISATTLSVPPIAPTGLSVLGVPTTTSIGLQWTAPTTGSTPFSYQVLSRLTGIGSFAVAAASTTALTQTITGLTPSTGYDFEVSASNIAGAGPVSAVLVNASTAAGSIGNAPTPATALTVSALAATTLTLSWTAPSAGTLPFTYQPQIALVGSSSFANIGSGISAVTVNVTGLTPNTGYQFQVITSNSAGSSTSASTSTATLSVLPGAPTGFAVVGSPAQTTVSLQWVAPAVGTLPFTYQVLSRSPTGVGSFVAAGGTTTGLTQTVSGLLAGTSYDFEITATNGAGTGAASSVLTNVVTAAGTGSVAPSAPTNLTAGTITQTSIAVSWTAPATGTPPLSYVVQYRLH